MKTLLVLCITFATVPALQAQAKCLRIGPAAPGGFYQLENQCGRELAVWFCNPNRPLGEDRIRAGQLKTIGAKVREPIRYQWCGLRANRLPECRPPTSDDVGCRTTPRRR